MTQRGILKDYNGTTHRATVQLVGSVTTYFDDIRVAKNIAGADMVLGRHVYVTLPDDYPGTGAVVTAVFDP